MTNISAVIVVKDNPPHLFECLKSIDGIVDEIVIMDIGVDSTIKVELNKLKKIKLVEADEKVLYVEQIRNKSIESAKNEYVLVLDPDEVVSEDLSKIIQNLAGKYDFVKIPRKNIIFGKWIEHARWWPDYQVRLFKKGYVSWPHKLHAQPKTQGREYTIEADENTAILHYNYENITECLMKMIRYAKNEAEEKSKSEYQLQDAFKDGLSEFVSRYFAGEGYKDGMHGFALSFLQMFYYFLVYIYVWEKNKYPKDDTEKINPAVKSFFTKGLYESNYWFKHKKLIKQNIKDTLITKLLK